ncbi:CoA transferase [Streptomyces antimicrobicus]|uniref:CoA transferase n=1 Tax=Streptomyces antimicrobicus TaxID=2883108 RepID=A0ABS8BAF8_9ACTN|nr:CoA transferase [Streptomyces antimicrobicus]MCB5181610.1 CoA transferase [Streptomyces antimicrobicus]
MDGDRWVRAVWETLGGAAGDAERVAWRGASGLGGGRLPVRELARAAVGVCSLAAAEAAGYAGQLVVDEGAVTTAFLSERQLRIGGRAPVPFAPLSGFWRAADGWVRTHANYPHHRDALVRALGLEAAEPGVLAQALAERTAQEAQEAVYAAGGLAVAVAGRYGPPQSLVEARTWRPRRRPVPVAGARVLDLTRVIAGPVATRTLGLLGADVLRIDAPGLPEDPDTYADTGFGKRSARLDLADGRDRAVFEELLARADVVVSGYRPGALARYGLGTEDLMARRPGLVVAELCAWGRWGPWAGRRGFDSLVQAGYGIAAAEAGPDGRPGVLPAQALDHGTGYLVAAGILRALAGGGGRSLRFSLAGTASWLVHEIAPAAAAAPAADAAPGAGAGCGSGAVAYDPEPWLRTKESGYGPLRHAAPPLAYGPPDWPTGPSRWGTDRPAWAT